MVNQYCPKVVCPKCFRELFCYDDSKKEVECAGSAFCRKEHIVIPKKIHGIIGAEISKDEAGNYCLKFPEYHEVDTYADWTDLLAELSKLSVNQDILDKEVDEGSINSHSQLLGRNKNGN